MSQKIVIFGNSVFAEFVYFLLTYDSPYDVVAFTVDQEYITAKRLFGLPVVPFETLESVYPPSDCKIIVSISFQMVNNLRKEKYLQAKKKGYELGNYVHSTVTSFPGLNVGKNCLIMENVTIGPLVEIGNNVIIATGAMIGHHSKIRDHCFISPGAVILGGVTVDEYCLIGANATIKEEVKVARECLIGSGVSITKNTQEKGVYVNPPAQLHPRRSDQLRTWLTWPLRQRKNPQNFQQK